MKWYKNLYMGETATDTKHKILRNVVKRRFSNNEYLITISANPDNLLDILPAEVLLQKHYKDNTDKLYIVGIANGKEEALEVVRQIIDEVYTNTGEFDIPGYLKFGRNL